MSAILEVSGLHKRFGKVVTARDLSFTLERGRALGVVGPNGAGKSTLLSLITGVLPVDAGVIRFDGQDVTRLRPGARSALGMARTFQVPRPFGTMTVFENACVAASFGGGESGQAGHDTARDALALTGLLHLANQPAGSLRLLDRKRLELARALATRPQLILLDEIAGGLTDKELPPLIEMLNGLKASGISMVWIEHIVHALVEVVDDLMCLAGGEILAQGSPRDVMTHPRVVEVYLGSTFDVDAAS